MLTKSQVKYIQSLNQKKLREENSVFVAEGPKIINELLNSDNIKPVALYATTEWWEKNTSLKNILTDVDFLEIQESELERISFLATAHQVLGIFTQPLFPGKVNFQNQISLLLDNIQDPGNLGTIIRIADWFGIQNIIASKDSADVFNPKVVQSTMGSVVRVQVMYEDLAGFLSAHKNIPVYAAALKGEPLQKSGKLKEGFLLIGNESKGLKEELLNLSHYQLTIPRYGKAESLNAAVATGIILSHLVEVSAK